MYPSILLILLITLISPTFSCDDDDGDDYSTGFCECPDMRTLLNTTRETYKDPTITRLAGCTYNFTCHCTTNTSVFCGYLDPKSLSNVINLPTYYNVVGIMDALIVGYAPQNIFETFGMECSNGQWYATKIPNSLWFWGNFSGDVRQASFPPEELVNTSIRIPEGGLTCPESGKKLAEQVAEQAFSYLSLSGMIFPEVITFINAILAWLSNGLLIFLILRNSPRSMANYKYLMLIFAIFGVIFGIIDITNQPILHFYQGCYVIFSKNPLGLPKKLSFWYIALNCACYAMTLTLLVFHFVYRFLTVCKPKYLYIFSIPYSAIPTVIFTLVTLEWWICSVFLAGESDLKTEYFKNDIYRHFKVTEYEYTYVSSLFYRVDYWTGKEYLSLSDCAFVINLAVIITTGFSIIFYCWFQIRYHLITSNHSQKTLDMQTQLFRALIAQTLFPVLFMFIPAGILLIFPIFKVEPGPIEGVILSLITTQPFIDAIIPMYFIKNYRKAIRKYCRRHNNVEDGRRISHSVENTAFSNKI